MKLAILAATITAIALTALPAGASDPCPTNPKLAPVTTGPVGIGVNNDTVVRRPIGKGVVRP